MSKIIKTDMGRAFFHAFTLINKGFKVSTTTRNHRLEVRTFVKGKQSVKILIPAA